MTTCNHPSSASVTGSFTPQRLLALALARLLVPRVVGGRGRGRGRGSILLILGILLVFSTSLIHPAEAAGAVCYGLNGKVNEGSTPCNANATGAAGSHSTCCNASNNDACLSTGLCLNTIASVPGHVIWATGCTDPTMKDPSCPQICQTVKGNGNYFLRSCSPDMTLNSWCCGKEGDSKVDCCKESFKLSGTIGTVVHQFGATAAVSDSLSHALSNSNNSSSTTNGDGGGGGAPDDRPALVAGLAAVSGFGGIAAVALVFAVLYIRRLREQLAHVQSTWRPPGSGPMRIVQQLPSLAPEPEPPYYGGSSHSHSRSRSLSPSSSPLPSPLQTNESLQLLQQIQLQQQQLQEQIRQQQQNQNYHQRPLKGGGLAVTTTTTSSSPPQPSSDEYLSALAAATTTVQLRRGDSISGSEYSGDGTSPGAGWDKFGGGGGGGNSKLELLGEEVREMFADEDAPWRAVELPNGERYESILFNNGCLRYARPPATGRDWGDDKKG